MRKFKLISPLFAFVLSASAQLTANLPTCASTHYYDSTQFKCMPCGENAVKDDTNETSCKCPAGYAKAEADFYKFKFSCTQCSAVSTILYQRKPNSR